MKALFGSGCFLKVQKAFDELSVKTMIGYSSGHVKNPSYKQVCSGITGHTELVQVTYDPQEVSYDELLSVFWEVHDPTIIWKEQYKSVIFYYNEEQEEKAEKLRKSQGEVVTEIRKAKEFYSKREWHQKHYQKSLVLLLIFLLLGCTSPGVIDLDEVEVRDYQGEDLSSINEFRENSISGPQQVNINEYELMIHGLVNNPTNLTYDEVLSHQSYKKVINLVCVEGWSVRVLWEGVLLKDLFNDANPLPAADTVIFRAVDGYSTSLPLEYVLENNIMLAYKINNVTLPAAHGFPFQLVAEDKWGYKWIKWVTSIELSNNTDYQGFWESRGFNDNGSLQLPRLD